MSSFHLLFAWTIQGTDSFFVELLRHIPHSPSSHRPFFLHLLLLLSAHLSPLRSLHRELCPRLVYLRLARAPPPPRS